MKMKMMKKKKAELPNDLIIDVLCKLRVKDIARFQCVSKAWERMIRDCCFPIVCKKKQPAEMLLFSDFVEIKAVSRYPSNLVFAPETVDSSELIDCCNGLLLLRCDYRDRYTSVVYNPINKEFVHIPEPNPPSRNFTIDAVLAFDPCVSRHYKVVQFSFAYYKFCFVFSSETWTWSRLKLGNEILHRWILSRPSFYLDGALYRLSFMTSQPLRISLDADIHKRKRAHAFRLPPEYRMELHCREARGCIGMTSTKDDNIHVGLCDAGNSNVRIWELRIDGGDKYDWVLKSTISVQTIAKRHGLNGILPCSFDPVLDKVFICGWVVQKPKQRKRRMVSDQKPLMKMLVYDLNNQELELFSTYENESTSYARFPFAPCLVHLEEQEA